jgi:hypothetical protein
MNKSFELQIEDPKLNAKIEAMANEWQISPDELVSRIIEKYVASFKGNS